MTRRVVAVAARSSTDALALAMLEDVVDLVEAMQEVEAALAVTPEAPAPVRAAVWPTMPVVEVPDPAKVVAVLDALSALGADEGAIVCADAPDVPVLLLGKLHSALTGTEVAACPAAAGGLVALAARLPAPGWLRDADPSLDEDDALATLRLAAPPRAFVTGPGWHRIRSAEDVGLLDPGLEGWEATRQALDA